MDEFLKRTLKQFKENESAISMFLGGLVVIVVGVLLFNYFRSDRPQPSISKTSETTESAEYTLSFDSDDSGIAIPKDLPQEHTVQANENLWQIANKYYGSGYNFTDIAKVNEIADPNQLAVGQKLTVPKVPVKRPGASIENDASGTTIPPTVQDSKSYTVQKGQSLWEIAEIVYNDGYAWTAIYQANRDIITNPSVIEPGWSLTIPPQTENVDVE